MSHVNVSGVWKSLVSGTAVNVSGVWKTVSSIHVNVSGVWKEAWAAAVYTLSGETGIADPQINPATSIVGIRVNADGTIDKREGSTYTQIDAATDYVIPNDADKTDVRFRATDNNANLAAGTTGSWVSAPHEWRIEQSGTGTKLMDVDLEISADAGTSTEDTGSYTGTAAVVPA